MKPVTLRATLRWLAIGALLYVVVIAAVIAVRITPTARALQAHSELVRGEYQAINERSVTLHSMIDEVQMWLYTVARPAAMGPAVADLRRRISGSIAANRLHCSGSFRPGSSCSGSSLAR